MPSKILPAPWNPEQKISEKQLDIFNCYHRFLLVCGPRNTGKCVDGDTLIRTAHGLKTIRDLIGPLKKGSAKSLNIPIRSFNTSSSKFEDDTIIAGWREPVAAGFKIETEWGYSIKTSPWHPLWCSIDGKTSYVTAEELKSLLESGKDIFLPTAKTHEWECDYQTCVFKIIDRKKDKGDAAFLRIADALKSSPNASLSEIKRKSGSFLPTIKRFLSGFRENRIREIKIDEDVAYCLGVLVGDGCISKSDNPNITISLTSADVEIVSNMTRILREKFNCHLSKSSGLYGYSLKNSGVIRSLITYLGMNKLAHEKSIPKEIVKSPKGVISAFLQGLFDTDGYCEKRWGTVQFCSTSETLSRQVHQLLLVFGINSRLFFKSNKKRGAWMIDIYSDSREFHTNIGFKIKRKADRAKETYRECYQIFPPEIQKRLHELYSSKTIKMSRAEWRTGKNRQWSNYANGTYSINNKRLDEMLSFIGKTGDSQIEKYRIEGLVNWKKIISIAECEVDLYDVETEKNHSFIGNGFINHNSIGVMQRVMRHLWETQNAFVAMVTKTTKVGKEGGVWLELIRDVVPSWLGLESDVTNMPLEYTSESRGIPGPRMDPATRAGSFKIRNYWGSDSTLVHLSLDNTDEVEAKFKGTKFSMVWFSEFSEFNDPNVFVQVIQSLRLGREEEQMFIGDTNPAPEGQDSWIYQKWYVEPHQKEHPYPLYQKQLKLIEVFLDDNPFLTAFKKEELIGSNASLNEADRARNVEGKWVKGSGSQGKYFADVVVPQIHFIEPAIDVDENTVDLFVGWDIGQVNHAAIILENRIVNNVTHWMVLDEIVTLSDTVSTEEFTWQVMQKMNKLETYYNRKFVWGHWSDDTATNQWRSSGGGGFDATEVLKASGNTIELRGVEKPEGSVHIGIKIIRRFLRENRLFVGNNCPKIQKMLWELREGKTKPVDDGENKHPFDALRYVIWSEERRYMTIASIPKGSDRMSIQNVG